MELFSIRIQRTFQLVSTAIVTLKATASSFLPCAPNLITCPIFDIYWIKIAIFGAVYIKPDAILQTSLKQTKKNSIDFSNMYEI